MILKQQDRLVFAAFSREKDRPDDFPLNQRPAGAAAYQQGCYSGQNQARFCTANPISHRIPPIPTVSAANPQVAALRTVAIHEKS